MAATENVPAHQHDLADLPVGTGPGKIQSYAEATANGAIGIVDYGLILSFQDTADPAKWLRDTSHGGGASYLATYYDTLAPYMLVDVVESYMAPWPLPGPGWSHVLGRRLNFPTFAALIAWCNAHASNPRPNSVIRCYVYDEVFGPRVIEPLRGVQPVNRFWSALRRKNNGMSSGDPVIDPTRNNWVVIPTMDAIWTELGFAGAHPQGVFWVGGRSRKQRWSAFPSLGVNYGAGALGVTGNMKAQKISTGAIETAGGLVWTTGPNPFFLYMQGATINVGRCNLDERVGKDRSVLLFGPVTAADHRAAYIRPVGVDTIHGLYHAGIAAGTHRLESNFALGDRGIMIMRIPTPPPWLAPSNYEYGKVGPYSLGTWGGWSKLGGHGATGDTVYFRIRDLSAPGRVSIVADTAMVARKRHIVGFQYEPTKVVL